MPGDVIGGLPVVVVHGHDVGEFRRAPDQDERELLLVKEADDRILVARLQQDDAVDPPALDQLGHGLDFLAFRHARLEQQIVAGAVRLAENSARNLREEDVEEGFVGIAGKQQSDRHGRPGDEVFGHGVRMIAQLLHDFLDLFRRRCAYSRAAGYDPRYGRRRHSGCFGHINDRYVHYLVTCANVCV